MSQNGHVSRSLCRALDGSNALTWNGRQWSAPVLIDLTGDGVESVSCASASFCMAVDWNGNALTWNGTGWSATAISCPDSTTASAGDCTTAGPFADPRAGVLDSVSCPTASFCAAVDGTGYTFTWNGTSWSRPVWSATSPADPHGGALTSVSCPTARFCVAVDGDGEALTWNGHAWTTPVSIDSRGGEPHRHLLPNHLVLHRRRQHRPGPDLERPRLDHTRQHRPPWRRPHRHLLPDPLVLHRRRQRRPSHDLERARLVCSQLIDPDGGGLTAISCPTAWSCTATDFTGRIVTLR
jgi:hypothetical protein